MTQPSKFKFVILAVLDGWGIAPPGPGNALSRANIPNMTSFVASYPNGELKASGQEVGLPKGEDGNSETGHINIGAGRIVYQDLEHINMSIAEGSFFKNEALLGAINHAKKNNSDLHLMGLIGAGGVHSSLSHLFALIQLAAREGFDERLYLHLFTDGRDSSPISAKTYIDNVKKVIEKEGIGKIASVMGRYWAMDRDQRWDRTKKAYDALTKGVGKLVKTVEEAIDDSYSQGKTDEFLEPCILTGNSGKPIAIIKDNDAVIFFNFRIDRPRQLTKAFIYKDFQNAHIIFDYDPHSSKYLKGHKDNVNKNNIKTFKRDVFLNNLYFATMTKYGQPIKDAGAKAAFPPKLVEKPLGEVIAKANMKQLRITESEKERFVTFYFNGLNEGRFDGEDRIIIPSPKVPNYDQRPEMNARLLTEILLDKLGEFKYQFVFVNYPNPDMIAHTGNIGPAVKAVEVVDECLGKLANFVIAYGGILIITADHGNVEEMINAKSGEIDTEHSSNPVPFIVISKEFMGKAVKLDDGVLGDIAPTVLKLLSIPIPVEMTGTDLLANVNVVE